MSFTVILFCSSCNLKSIGTVYAYIDYCLSVIYVEFLCNFPNLIPFSPDGGQFETYKDVSSYLVSLFNVQDAGELKSCYTDGSKQFSSNINISENVS